MAARREYMRSFRRSIEQQVVAPAQLRFNDPDPQSVETLVSELAHPEPRRVLYAIDLLEAMDKRHLVTPLLLAHESPEVRARALAVAEASGPTLADRWLPGVERALKDSDAAVRIAAVSALAALRGEAAVDVMRPFIKKGDPALAIVAAAALAAQQRGRRSLPPPKTRCGKYSADTREPATPWRLQVARALGDVKNPAFRPLLVPLMYDANLEVARAAIESAATLGAHDFLFVPPLVSLMRNRRLKSAARAVLVGYGEPVVAPLAFFMRDPRGGQVGAPACAIDARGAALPIVSRRADRRARRRGRLHSVQGHQRAGSAAPHASRSRDRRRGDHRATPLRRRRAPSTR